MRRWWHRGGRGDHLCASASGPLTFDAPCGRGNGCGAGSEARPGTRGGLAARADAAVARAVAARDYRILGPGQGLLASFWLEPRTARLARAAGGTGAPCARAHLERRRGRGSPHLEQVPMGDGHHLVSRRRCGPERREAASAAAVHRHAQPPCVRARKQRRLFRACECLRARCT